MNMFAQNGLSGLIGRIALIEIQKRNELVAKKNDSECVARKMDVQEMQLNMIR